MTEISLNAEWATRIGGSGLKEIYDIDIDTNGNIYATGVYSSNPATIYNSDGSVFGTLASDGSNVSFLVKYNNLGFVQWATRIDGPGGDGSSGLSIDINNDIYVVGSYSSNPVNIYNADGSVFGTLANNGSNDLFLVQYNSSGFAQWATRIGGTGFDQGVGVDTDSSGNVYLICNYGSNPATVYNANGSVFGVLSSISSLNIGIVKYNSVGICQWVTRFQGNGYGITVEPSGTLYISGSNSSSTQIYNSDNSEFVNLENPESGSTFVIKFNSSGFGQWATYVTGIGLTIKVDINSNLYVSGNYFSSPMTIYNSDDSVFGTLTSNNTGGAFIVKYNSSGFGQWATSIDGTSSEGTAKITTDVFGNVYITGYYDSDQSTIYNSDGSAFGVLENVTNYGTFVIRYNSLGFAQVATRIDGDNYDQGYSIVTDSNRNVYVSGYYESDPITVYNSDGSEFGNLNFDGSVSTFLVKFNSSGDLTETSGINVWWVISIITVFASLAILIFYARNAK